MSNKKYEQQLEALDQLREDLSSPATVDSLRKALSNRNNYLVAKAAKITAEAGLKDSLSADPGRSCSPQKSAKTEQRTERFGRGAHDLPQKHRFRSTASHGGTLGRNVEDAAALHSRYDALGPQGNIRRLSQSVRCIRPVDC